MRALVPPLEVLSYPPPADFSLSQSYQVHSLLCLINPSSFCIPTCIFQILLCITCIQYLFFDIPKYSQIVHSLFYLHLSLLQRSHLFFRLTQPKLRRCRSFCVFISFHLQRKFKKWLTTLFHSQNSVQEFPIPTASNVSYLTASAIHHRLPQKTRMKGLESKPIEN